MLCRLGYPCDRDKAAEVQFDCLLETWARERALFQVRESLGLGT
jgi:hypothetical protein